MLMNALGELMRHPPWFARSSRDAPAGLDMLTPPTEMPTRWKSPLNATITAHRSVALVDVPFDDVRTVKDRVGCTVNDVVLAMCAGALRRLIERAGLVDAPSLVAGVPVSIRTEAERETMGNRVSFMLVPLATDVAEPLDRLLAIRGHTAAAKERHNPVEARALMDWAVIGGPPLVARAAQTYSLLRMADLAGPDFHVVVSNIPGPTGPVLREQPDDGALPDGTAR
jgi:diacylglycerol O-acyltransferase